MSAATPAASTPDGVSPAAPNPPPAEGSSSNVTDLDRMVLEYLRSRGHKDPEKVLEEIEKVSSPDDKGKQPETSSLHAISQEELVKQLAIFVQKPANPDENALKDSSSVLQELSTMGNPQNIQNLISSIGSVGAEEILSLDPTDKHEGFRELEAWVDGSLDMYRVCQCLVKHLCTAHTPCSLSSALYSFPYSATSTSIWFNMASEKLVCTGLPRTLHASVD